MGKKQKLIFWQNIISPHQLDFLKAISFYYDVVLIVEEVQDRYRNKDGWEIPDCDFLKVVIAPSDDVIGTNFQNKNDFHIFSGISAYKTVFKGFQTAVKHNASIGVLSEPIDLRGIKGFLKLVRGKIQCWKYKKHIHFIATTGNLGVNTYLKFGYENEKIFHWGYFVDVKEHSFKEKKNELSFVGNLNRNKQVKPLLEMLLKNEFYGFDKINIIGTGILESELVHLYRNESKVVFFGRLTNKDTLKKISSSSLLVIPSLNDGWGVVVNEALLCGTPVIASDQVGANILLNNSKRGEVFKAGDFNQLKEVLNRWSKYNLQTKDYQDIQYWAKNKISPIVAAQYFTEILNFVNDNGIQKPTAPWLK